MVFIAKFKYKNYIGFFKIIFFPLLLTFHSQVFSYEIPLNNRCGDIFKASPWDYNDPKNHIYNLGMVESFHFTESVRTLKRGNTHIEPMADLAYTLNKFPNHYPALLVTIEYDLRLNGKLPQVKGSEYEISIDCLFYRAFTFKPSDLNLRHLYGIYFYRNKKFEQALQEFKKAESLNSAEVFYNIGLTYFELGNFELSLEYAEKAKNLGYPQEGLLRKLKEKNK